ncbi:hypothetical protein BJ508DRAFT_316436, partial [Ascobolus immersus RN42]
MARLTQQTNKRSSNPLNSITYRAKTNGVPTSTRATTSKPTTGKRYKPTIHRRGDRQPGHSYGEDYGVDPEHSDLQPRHSHALTQSRRHEEKSHDRYHEHVNHRPRESIITDKQTDN